MFNIEDADTFFIQNKKWEGGENQPFALLSPELIRPLVDRFPFDLSKLLNEKQMKIDETLMMSNWWPEPFKNGFW